MCSINIFKPLSTFLLPVPLIDLNNTKNFSSEKISATLGAKPRGAGFVSQLFHPFSLLSFYYLGFFFEDCPGRDANPGSVGSRLLDLPNDLSKTTQLLRPPPQ